MAPLLALWLAAAASASPPPQPTVDAPTRIAGFTRLYVTPTAFADGLRPDAPDAPAVPDAPEDATVEGFVPAPVAVAPPPPGFDLIIASGLTAAAVVSIDGVQIGVLAPLGRGVLRDVAPGAYTVVLTSANGGVRTEVVEARRRISEAAPSPPPPP